MRTIALINPKGGSGKTTAAVALADALARLEGPTLLIDLDPNAGATAACGVPAHAIEKHAGDALATPRFGARDADGLLWPVRKRLSVLPAAFALARVEQGGSALSLAPDRDLRLRRVCRHFADGFAWCVVDTGPALSVLAFNALRAAGAVVVPADLASAACVASTERALAAVDAVRRRSGAAGVTRVLPVRASERAVAVGNAGAIAERWGALCLGTPEGGAVSLPDDGVFAEAALLGRLPSEHGGSRAGVVWAERAAVSLSAALGGEAEAASLELKPVDGAGGGSFSVPLAEGGAGLLDFGGDGGIAQPAAQQDFHDRGDGSRPAGVVAAGGYEAKPRAGSIGLGAVGDGDGAVTSRAAELAARTRALSARLAERDRAMAADPSLAAAVREAERAGPLRRRA